MMLAEEFQAHSGVGFIRGTRFVLHCGPPTPTPGYEYFKVCLVQFSLQQCGNLDDTKPDWLLKFLSSSFLPAVPQAGTD